MGFFGFISVDNKMKKYKYVNRCFVCPGESIDRNTIFMTIMKKLTKKDINNMSKKRWIPQYQPWGNIIIVTADNITLEVVWRKQVDIKIPRQLLEKINELNSVIERISYKKREK
jgi:hypothetical protein